ncbi:MAG TPA: hypothetical protein IGR64_01075 [Leptolyngbyaceae cyanobacterium M65_K2018_010]|nr:hypothetical protein [Leptolyngbyaceae cyanobacterium M65_K2018_010]
MIHFPVFFTREVGCSPIQGRCRSTGQPIAETVSIAETVCSDDRKNPEG